MPRPTRDRLRRETPSGGQDRADHLYRMARKIRNMHRVEPASTGPVVGGGLHLRAHLVRDGDAIA